MYEIASRYAQKPFHREVREPKEEWEREFG
jgi:hypothetical protein